MIPLAVRLQEDEVIVGVDARDISVDIGILKVVDEGDWQILAVPAGGACV